MGDRCGRVIGVCAQTPAEDQFAGWRARAPISAFSRSIIWLASRLSRRFNRNSGTSSDRFLFDYGPIADALEHVAGPDLGHELGDLGIVGESGEGERCRLRHGECCRYPV